MINALYLHVPFCRTICGYCDFCHFVYRKDKVDLWLEGLKEELNDKDINKNLKTVYIGGGTPTSLDIEQLERLLILLKPYTNCVEEYTVEVNPETITVDKIKLLKKYKVNRVSIGVQSSDDKLLKLMNRHHDFNLVKRVIEDFKKLEITNISVDLMYGLPKQTLAVLKTTLEDFISLDVPHISIYSLTVEENTPFYKQGYKAADNELEADMYDYIIDFLSKHGYVQYEISSFARDNLVSKHNLAYWHYEDFYGISMSASGKENNVRYDNTSDFKKYLSYNYVDNFIVLTKNDMMFEYIMMGLRLKEGINILKFNELYEEDFMVKYQKVINNLLEKKLIVLDDNNLKCSDSGFKILNTVLEDFME